MCYDTGKGGSNMEKRKSWVVVLLGILLVLKIFVSCEYFVTVRLETLDALFALFLIPVDLVLTGAYISLACWKKFCTRIICLISAGICLIFLLFWILPSTFGISDILNDLGIWDFIVYYVPLILSVVLLCDYLLHIIWFAQGKCIIPIHKRAERANLRPWYFGALILLCGKIVLSCIIFLMQKTSFAALANIFLMPIDVVYIGVYLVYIYKNGIGTKTAVYSAAVLYVIYCILGILSIFISHSVFWSLQDYVVYMPFLILAILLADAVVYGFRRVRKRGQ